MSSMIVIFGFTMVFESHLSILPAEVAGGGGLKTWFEMFDDESEIFLPGVNIKQQHKISIKV